MAVEDMFDGVADFEAPIYGKDGAKGTKIVDRKMIAENVPMQACPVTPFQQLYDTEVSGMVRGWEVLVLDPGWEPNQNLLVTLKGAGYNNNHITINSFERFNNAGSTIPIYIAFQGEEYKGTGDSQL